VSLAGYNWLPVISARNPLVNIKYGMNIARAKNLKGVELIIELGCKASFLLPFNLSETDLPNLDAPCHRASPPKMQNGARRNRVI